MSQDSTTTTSNHDQWGGAYSTAISLSVPTITAYRCRGAHRFFVAETAAAEGNIHIFAICTDCGEAIHRSFSVASQNASITLK